MKKLLVSIICIFIAMFVFISGCEKDDEILASVVEIKNEVIEKGWDYLKISTEYSYPEELKSVDLHLSTNADMSGATVHGCSVEGKNISIEIQGLQDGVQYYYCYEYDNGYSKEKSEKMSVPVLSAVIISEVSIISAKLDCNVTSTDEVNKITTRGFCWGITQNPTIEGLHTTEGSGTGDFTSELTGLTGTTTYYVRAYATNEKGTVYGEEKSFTTLASEWVDLGLPSGLKWATCNVGASSPEEYGNYYAWGETEPKLTYTEYNSITYGEQMGDISGDPEYDAATANWGSTWRMPTEEECEELDDECTWQWTTQNGVYGRKVTGPNGNYIFLPAAGYRSGSSLYNAGEDGYYWSSTPNESNSGTACDLRFDSEAHNVGWYYRYHGRSVRPVSE